MVLRKRADQPKKEMRVAEIWPGPRLYAASPSAWEQVAAITSGVSPYSEPPPGMNIVKGGVQRMLAYEWRNRIAAMILGCGTFHDKFNGAKSDSRYFAMG